MADPVTATALSVFLFVAHVGENNGFPNTPDAAYVCGFDQAHYVLPRAGSVDVHFVPSTDTRFVMSSVRVDGDSAGDYGQRSALIGARSLAFSAANRTKQTVYFTIDVLDQKTQQRVSCDPVIINEGEQ